MKHEKGAKESIVELKSLIPRHRVNNNSTNNTGTSGSLSDRITKMLIYGKGRKSDTDLEIGKIKKASNDFAKQKKEQKQGKTKQYKDKRKQIQDQVKKLKERWNNINMPWGEISDWENVEFYGFCDDFERKKERKYKNN